MQRSKSISVLTTGLTLGLLAWSVPCLAQQKHFVVFGGGGEPAGPQTMFDTAIETLGGQLKMTAWSVDVAYDGGHTLSEVMIAKHFPKVGAQKPFTQSSYTLAIQSLIQKIESKQIKPGGQIVVALNTHGSTRERSRPTQDPWSSKNRPLSHSVSVAGGAITNTETLAGSETVSLDDLAPLIDAAKSAGILVGILDFSCHSGATMALKASNTCIITASGPNHYAYQDFPETFFSKLKSGTSLEAAFLEARIAAAAPAFPMISTAEGEQSAAEYYDLITPYLYYADQKDDKLSPYLLNNGNAEAICRKNNEFESLLQKIKSIEQVSKNAPASKVDYSKLQNLLTEYKRLQERSLEALRRLGVAQLDQTEKFSQGDFSFSPTWRDIITYDVKKSIKQFEKQVANAQTREDAAHSRNVLAVWKKIAKRQKEILAKHPRLRTHTAAIEEIKRNIENNFNTARAIAIEERRLYHALYTRRASEARGKSKSPSNLPYEADPCRKIKL